jgi:ABC-2 type transport system ATP-binding protein
MSAIVVDRLSKSFRVHKREGGLLGAARSLFRRKYETVPAVREVSFSIRPGEFVGFLGPNGAGKTTTLKMLSGLMVPDSGAATVLGHTPWLREDAFRRRFALVMGQKNQLWWDLPAADSFLLNKEIYGIDGPTYRKKLDELLGLLAVGGKVGVPVRELSLGERMKMELVAALLHSPEVLFLDEPTIGLDVVAQANIRECLRRYNREHGVTVVLTSHYMKDIQALCPRVIIINGGRIMHDGPLSGALGPAGRRKTVRVRFAEGAALPAESVAAAAGGVAAKPSPGNPLELTWELDRDGVPALLGGLLSRPGVEDISIEDPPIEEVIAEVFAAQPGAGPTQTQAGAASAAGG